MNGTEDSCSNHCIVASCSFVHLHGRYRRISYFLHHVRFERYKCRGFVRQKYRFTSALVGTHHQTSAYIGTHRFTSANIGTNRYTSVHKRFKSSHIGIHRHMSVHIDRHLYTSAHMGKIPKLAALHCTRLLHLWLGLPVPRLVVADRAVRIASNNCDRYISHIPSCFAKAVCRPTIQIAC